MIQPYALTPVTPLPGLAATFTTLSDGRVIEVWEGADFHSVSAQFYHLDGSADGAAFTLISGNDGVSKPFVAATGSGGFIVAYSGITPDYSTTYAATAVFDGSGTAAVSTSSLQSANTSVLSIAADQATGQTVMIATVTGTKEVVFGNINGTEGPATPLQPVPSPLGGFQTPYPGASVVELAGGNYAVSFPMFDRSADQQTTSFEDWVDIYKADGSFWKSVEAYHGDDHVNGGLPQIAALKDGGFAVTYQFSTNAGVNVFNADGSSRLAQPIVLSNAQRPFIAGLTNGLFAVEWGDASTPAGVHQQVYNPDGTPYGSP